MIEAKPYRIPKRLVWEAFKKVKANAGAAGVDGQSILDFEGDLRGNLYKLWNRMSSGSYFPPPVRRVEIPKKDGGVRPLGIPTVADRVAQMVVNMWFEPLVEPHFHPDSFAYRPGKSAKQALEITRRRCWRYDWVLDLDIRGFFDNIDHQLLMKAVRKHTDCPWVLLYIQRWLEASVAMPDGNIVRRDRGTPQGGVISPLLANLFLHYAFDKWIGRTFPAVPFERYADDLVAHCATEQQAQQLKAAVAARLAECKLELHPEKTKIVYCKDDDRGGTYVHEKFDFLGYTFRARRSKNRWGKYFVNFCPAISNAAATKIRRTIRSWGLHAKSDKSILDLSRMFRPVLQGWLNYYSSFYKSAMYPIWRHLNRILARWVMRKYKRMRRHKRRADHWLGQIARREPKLFPHWMFSGLRPAAGQ